IVILFWYNEFVYSLPTPIPKDYKTVKLGEKIDLKGKIRTGNNPLFLHFFNPDCPCSKFNISYFKSLVKKYGKEATFEIIVMSSDMDYTAKQIQDKFDLKVPVLFDSSLAVACGVYSTPQAVILDADNRLYYRGNYNRSRYCTDVKSNYAQMALDSLLQQNFHPVFNQYALTAYGCQLPKCTK
ncbi:MAG: hypothetical protein JWQ09_829, partial [Segetibacter sp.]|nr:hypothetical protein [Segetibacter sp.]